MVSCVLWPLAPDLPASYGEFWQLWQEEKFFECHEVLEILWRETNGEQKLFYQGLIHCAVAIYQHRRGNAYGAARQFCRARVKLKGFGPRYLQVDIVCLLNAVAEEIAASLAGLDAGQRNGIRALEKALNAEMQGRNDRNYSQEFRG